MYLLIARRRTVIAAFHKNSLFNMDCACISLSHNDLRGAIPNSRIKKLAGSRHDATDNCQTEEWSLSISGTTAIGCYFRLFDHLFLRRLVMIPPPRIEDTTPSDNDMPTSMWKYSSTIFRPTKPKTRATAGLMYSRSLTALATRV